VFDGPWLVRHAVGKGNKAAKLGEHIELKYYVGPHHFEIDVNVSQSAFGNRILSVVTSYISSVSIDLGFVVEGVEEAQLPERVLGALRFHSLDLPNAPFLPPQSATSPTEENPRLSPSSINSRSHIPPIQSAH